jgi:thymidine kinase
MSQLSSEGRSLVRLVVQSDKVWIIDAICINCNKRFKSVRAVTMHLKMTAARHAVNFIDHGNYNKKTGLRKLKRVGK